jgi:CubicO group peptidase (beta-lactamase class C family)
VLLAQHGQVLFSHAYGYCDRSTRRLNTLETRFRVGSVSKAFTAIAILQLVQAGKIKLADPVGAYLGNFQNKSIGDGAYREVSDPSGGSQRAAGRPDAREEP